MAETIRTEQVLPDYGQELLDALEVVYPWAKAAAVNGSCMLVIHDSVDLIANHNAAVWDATSVDVLSRDIGYVNMGGLDWNDTLHVFGVSLAERFPKDTPVWVRDYNHEAWELLYSSGQVDEEGLLLCYRNGRTSITDDEGVDSWQYVKPYNTDLVHVDG